jgi:hypothetical protein
MIDEACLMLTIDDVDWDPTESCPTIPSRPRVRSLQHSGVEKLNLLLGIGHVSVSYDGSILEN